MTWFDLNGKNWQQMNDGKFRLNGKGSIDLAGMIEDGMRSLIRDKYRNFELGKCAEDELIWMVVQEMTLDEVCGDQTARKIGFVRAFCCVFSCTYNPMTI